VSNGENDGDIEQADSQRARLENFRRYTASYIESFTTAKNRIFNLLHRQQQASGIFREGLLKDFFRALLPANVAVDSGFIYAFDLLPPSGQLDILIWDSGRHAPVFRSSDFVIVPPESVIAVLSVKSNLQNRDIDSGLCNLLSITPIELRFRNFLAKDDQHPIFPPITKILVAYDSRRVPARIQQRVANFFTDLFAQDAALSAYLRETFTQIDPRNPSHRDQFLISRILPRMIGTVRLCGPSFSIGYGPPDDLFGNQRFGPGLRRLPYIYQQANEVTRSFEKITFEVLQSVYRILGTLGWSHTSAWIDIDPDRGVRGGLDAWELQENTGLRLLDPDNLAG
jgi:hypothetical protein